MAVDLMDLAGPDCHRAGELAGPTVAAASPTVLPARPETTVDLSAVDLIVVDLSAVDLTRATEAVEHSPSYWVRRRRQQALVARVVEGQRDLR